MSILSLPAPEFLNIFGLVAFLVLAATAIVIRSADRSDRRPPPVPQTPEAIEVAFLQGGLDQVIRTLVYDLVQRGYVTLGKDDCVMPTDRAPGHGELDLLEARVLETIRQKPTARQLFADMAQRRDMLFLLEPVRARLAAQDLLEPVSVSVWRRRAQVVGAFILLGLAGARIYVETTTGHGNVAYLVFLCLASILCLLALAYVMTSGHTSRRGRAWLAAMELAYRERLDEAVKALNESGGARGFDGAALFLIALYGYSALKDTPDAIFVDYFEGASET